MKTTEYRFQISCSHCGLIDTARTFNEAKDIAYHSKGLHYQADEFIEICDIMAHKNKPSLFTADGLVIK